MGYPGNYFTVLIVCLISVAFWTALTWAAL